MSYLNVLVLFLGLISMSTASFAARTGIEIRNAWIPQAPPVANVMAGYMEVDNISSKPITIIGVSSPAFKNVMMHKTVEKNGMSTMIHMPKLTVAAKSKLVFKRGGYHLMLMSPKHPLKIGDKVSFTMELANKHHVRFTAVVKSDSMGIN